MLNHQDLIIRLAAEGQKDIYREGCFGRVPVSILMITIDVCAPLGCTNALLSNSMETHLLANT